jgi:transcriptional antiterminator NusG
MADFSPKQWYAVRTRSNQERTTAAFLEDRRVNHFYPRFREARQRRDRQVLVDRPLFPGYLFVYLHLNDSERVEVMRAPGFVNLVGFSEGPVPVPDVTIDSLKILVAEGDGKVAPHPMIQVGRKVKVIAGPFAGAVGKLDRRKGRQVQLVVEVELFNRAVAVPIDPEQVRPL